MSCLGIAFPIKIYFEIYIIFQPREKQSKSSAISKREVKSQVVVTKPSYESDSEMSDPQSALMDRDTEMLLRQRTLLQRELIQLSKEEDGESDRNSRNSARPEQVGLFCPGS